MCRGRTDFFFEYGLGFGQRALVIGHSPSDDHPFSFLMISLLPSGLLVLLIDLIGGGVSFHNFRNYQYLMRFPFTQVTNWKSTSFEPATKMAVFTTRLLSDAHRYILRCLGTHQTIADCRIFTSIPEVLCSAEITDAIG